MCGAPRNVETWGRVKFGMCGRQDVKLNNADVRRVKTSGNEGVGTFGSQGMKALGHPDRRQGRDYSI